MRSPSVFSRLGLSLALAALFTPALRADQAKPAPPTDLDQLVKVLFSPGAVEEATLAPDGRHLAFTCLVNGQTVGGVYDLQRRTQKLAGSGTRWIRWIGSDSLLLGLGYHIYTSDIDFSDVRDLLPSDLRVGWKLENWRPQDPDHVLLRSFPHNSFLYCDLEALTVSTRRFRELEGDLGHVVDWTIDEKGLARLAISPERNFTNSYKYREGVDAPWHSEPLPNTTDPLFFLADGQSILITHSDGQDRRVMQVYDLQQHHLVGNPLLSDPSCDIGAAVIRDNQTGTPIGLRYETEKPQIYWLNPEYHKVHTIIQRNFPGQIVNIFGLMPGNRVLFSVHADLAPWALYTLDLAHPAISLMFENKPAVSKYAWAPMQPISFSARDGYGLHGYLTLPLRRKAGQPVPLIALSHGGPRDRDEWYFNNEVQYFAALGYAVLQVNYRGSSGYGKAHELKSTLEVCEKSVDDVVDGINWAVKYSYADPKRIAVYGSDYGGYISLAIATRYPELPAAALAFDGIYEWEKHYNFDDVEHHEWHSFLFNTDDYFIDPKTAADRYRAFSPLHFADKVRCPVLLGRNGNDMGVDIDQTKMMVSALHDNGKPVEVLLQGESYYNATHEKERLSYFRKLGEFLLKNVPPDPAS